MKIFRFRVLIDTGEEDVFRDIDIKPTQTFEDFHNAIQLAFEFDNSQMASFYLSDDDWSKGDEITLFDMNEDVSDKIMVMKKIKLSELVEDENQKLIYIFDFMNVWKFYVELIQIIPKAQKITYPAVINFEGKAPVQYADGLVPKDEDAILASLSESDPFLGEDPYTDDVFGEFDDYNSL